MIDKILRAKHWQLFIITFGIPFIAQIITMATVVSTVVTNEGQPQSITPFLIVGILFMLIVVLVMFVQIGWFWGVGTKLIEYTDLRLSLKVLKFKWAFIIPFGYFGILILYALFTIASTSPPSPFIFLFVLPMHLFSFVCMLYVVYFCAKTIKSIEEKRVVTFSDCVGEFFLILFFVIGIWFIQPRINKIVEEQKKDGELIDM